MEELEFDVVVIGGGPAGIGALQKLQEHENLKVCVIEREDQLGGILKQCIHQGFGLARHKELMSGPEYANREIKALKFNNIKVLSQTFVLKIEDVKPGYLIECINSTGAIKIKTSRIIFSTGCRERTPKQILISGPNLSGVMTAGKAQKYINRMGKLPGKNAVILGSGDIGLIMARRITFEGGKVLGVYEIRPTPSGLKRNIIQCLEDYNIPLYLSHTVTKVIGQDKLEAIEVAKLNPDGSVIDSTRETIPCDLLVVSVGLIPENELAESIGVQLNPLTNGIIVDQDFRSINCPNIYGCGNSVHVYDLVDYCSESGEIAGNAASVSQDTPNYVDITMDKNIRNCAPNKINTNSNLEKVVLSFRSSGDYGKKVFKVKYKDEVLYKEVINDVHAAESKRVVLNLSKLDKSSKETINLVLEAE